MVNEVTKPLEALVIVVATMDLIKALSERQWLMWHLIKDIIVEEVLDKEAIAKAIMEDKLSPSTGKEKTTHIPGQ
jgi:hypothetical protein